MSLARQLFLGSLIAALAAGSALAGDPDGVLPNGIASGDVTTSSIVLWTRSTSVGGTVLFQLAEEGDPSAGAQATTAVVADALEPLKVRFAHLSPATAYVYRVTDLATGAFLDGRFRTPAESGRQALRFGVSGDWRGELAPYPAVKNVPARDLDFFVELGDTIYADDTSPVLGSKPQAETLEEYRLKYTEVYGAVAGLNALADLRASTAVFAMIDDHEVTNDFAGGADVASDPTFNDPPGTLINDSALYETGLQAFLDYHPIVDESWGDNGDPLTSGEHRLYRSSRFGQTAQILLLDARSFRDEELPEVANPTDPAAIAAFLQASFDPSRTMLGKVQLRQLIRGLRGAQQAGVLWKFVLVPEPIQNLGPAAASDRFEGYAAERDALLAFIQQQGIENVVFVTADFHGTLVNDLTRTDPSTIATGQYVQLPVPAFEVITGAVAYDAPLGPTIAGLAFLAGLIDAQTFQFLTTPTGDLVLSGLQSAGVEQILDGLIDLLPLLGGPSYSHLGLDDSPLVDAHLLSGSYVATHTYGWTEFEIDPVTGVLTVITWGLPWYPEALVTGNPALIAALAPAEVSRFEVVPSGN